MRYLVDSDWVIDYLHEVERTAGRLGELAADGLGLSIVSLAELYEGLFHSQRPEADEQVLQAFLSGVDVVDLDEETCRIFARERARLRAAGNLIGDLDLLIGATALRHGLTILTNNRRHFDRIEGLTVESV
ncbi:MAG: type II toxin-antitoxin system VapC family toxin [Chloroflexi bacterium]|nr:type II toxin-antitoxin system VapC family toxin [Chloroflexota bacterium]